VAYDLPGTANARILWGTGRGNYQRTGSFLVCNLQNSSVSAAPLTPTAGETVTYTIRLQNSGPTLYSVAVTSTIPADTTYAGGLSASSGTAVYNAGQVIWSGAVSSQTPVIIRYTATVNGDVTEPQPIWGAVQINDGEGNVHTLETLVIANGQAVYLPIMRKP
jgi:uncharacterized repeat protein (TIGR01451 family)